jgi:hypothetical protein
MHRVKRLLLTDLENNGSQASIDLEADARFAKIIGDPISEKTILEAIEAGETSELPKNCGLIAIGIRDRRLRVLNGLVKMKLVKAGWTGTKSGGIKNIGVNRVRIYTLSTSVDITKMCEYRRDIINKIRSPKAGV